MKVEMYSDVACPWCYIGAARFQRALASFPAADQVDIAYRPFQLDPRAPARGVPMLAYLEQRYGGNARTMADRVSAVAREEGLVLDFDRGLAVNTFQAHRLMWLARAECGLAVQRALAMTLFEAHFAQGVDVGDTEVLATLADAVGMHGARAREYLTGDDDSDEVRLELLEARQLGIQAVPTFVLDARCAVEGAQPPEVLLDALEAVQRDRASRAVA